jgi:hypothetical protein
MTGKLTALGEKLAGRIWSPPWRAAGAREAHDHGDGDLVTMGQAPGNHGDASTGGNGQGH